MDRDPLPAHISAPGSQEPHTSYDEAEDDPAEDDPAEDDPAEDGSGDDVGLDDEGLDDEGLDDEDLARSALADARRVSRTVPGRRLARGSQQARRRNRDENLGGRSTPRPRRGGYSSAGPDVERDPQPLGSVLSGYVADRGWERPIAEGRVFADWSSLVGPDVAAHCSPQGLRDGELRVAAESTAWASQLRLLSGTLLARLVAELGPEIVTSLVITGPVGPSWKHGPRSLRGARGPRDTYG